MQKRPRSLAEALVEEWAGEGHCDEQSFVVQAHLAREHVSGSSDLPGQHNLLSRQGILR